MKLAIGITAAARPNGEDYLSATMASMRQAGFDDPMTVFAEPNLFVPSSGNLEVVVNSERLGCYRNFRSGLTWLVENTTADWLLMVQDDVVFRNDAASRTYAGMDRWDKDEIGLLSPYCSAAMVGRPPRIRKMEAWHDAVFYNRAFWGALTLCFRRAAAVQLLALPRFTTHNHHRKVDVLVGNCIRRELGLRLLVHAPSLANHTGKVSTLGRHKVTGIAWGRQGFRFREHA